MTWLRERTEHSAVRASLVRFSAGSVLALLVLGLASTLVAARVAREEALHDGQRKVGAIGRTLAGPLVTTEVRARTPGAAEQLDTVLMNRMSDGTLSHVKVWSSDGTVIWADEPTAVGRSFDLSDDVKSLFGTEETVARVTEIYGDDIDSQERGEWLEVYAGAHDADGTPIVFEAYLPTAAMHQDRATLTRTIVPLVLGALVLFQLAVLPLAVSLAQRVDRAQAERERMMRHALDASDLERRRIAHDLHDGVIQDLAGLGYAMPSVVAHLLSPGQEAARETIELVSQVLSRDVWVLRSMVTDIYPPALDGGLLATALEELAQQTERHGVTVTTDVRVHPTLSEHAARLVYRVAREGLLNVVKHARANSAVVEVASDVDNVVVRVSDDGAGPDSGGVGSAPNHLGLRLLEDTLRDFGGTLGLVDGVPSGAVLEAVFPTRPPR